MKKVFFLTLILFTLSAVSCKSLKDGKDGTKALEIELIQSGELYGGGAEGIEESLVVCNSKAELDAICKKMNSVNHETSALDDLGDSDIDFDTQSIVVYFQPVRSTGGYSLSEESLTRVKVDGEKSYIIHFSLTSPQGAAITVLTQPYIFVITSKIDGPVKYKVSPKGSL
jgi:hypothetical protein